jgi:hypothetical protein
LQAHYHQQATVDTTPDMSDEEAAQFAVEMRKTIDALRERKDVPA